MTDKDSPSSASPALPSKSLWLQQPPATTLVARNKLFMHQELLADCHLVVGPEKTRLPAHRYVLSIASWIFYNSFYLLHLNEFQLPDAQSDDVRAFLAFLYTDDVPQMDKHNVHALLKLALDLEVQPLEQRCIAFIEQHLLSIQNVVEWLATAHQLRSDELIRKTRQVIEWTTRDVMQSEAFLRANRDTLELILDMPQLNCTEFQLYEGVMQWVESQQAAERKVSNVSNEKNKRGAAAINDQQQAASPPPPSVPHQKKRDLLGSCLYKLRFPTMTAEEFSECAKEAELLTADEIKTIFLKIMNKTTTQTTPTADLAASESNHNLLLFSAVPRQIKLGFHVSGIWIFNRFVKWAPSATLGNVVPKHSTLVRVNKPVVVVGMGILMRHDDLSLTEITVHINGRHEQLAEKRTDLMYRLELENGLDIVRILLDQPVLLETDEVYLIQITHSNGRLLEIEGQVRDTIVNEDLQVTFVKPKQSPYINSIAEVFIHKG